MKRTIFFLVLLLPALTRAQFSYLDNGNGTCTITGYTNQEPTVTLPSTINGLTVTSIGANAFQFNLYLANVTIPGSVTNIGPEAFFLCGNLASITIPGSVSSIGDEAFEYCT